MDVLCIVGPTAVGKTKMSIELAKRLNGEIISGDSMQIYRTLDIGTAKITMDEREGIVHHLIDEKDLNNRIRLQIFNEQCVKRFLRLNLVVSFRLLWVERVCILKVFYTIMSL